MILMHFLIISYILKVSKQEEPNNFKFLPKELEKELKITDYIVESFIKNRYLESIYTIKVKNEGKLPSGTTFSVVIPDGGFITSFTLDLNGKNYPGFIKSQSEVDNLYKEHVKDAKATVSTKNSIVVSTDAIVEPKHRGTFQLVFEQLLERRNGRYEIVTSIQPGQFVENLNISLFIEESDALAFVNAHPFQSGRATSSKANILKEVRDKTSYINFNPDLNSQISLVCSGEGLKEIDGFVGQLIVDYDVERDFSGGSLFYQDGYFINFFGFAPNSTDLDPLKKHIVFVLDTSDSMRKENKLSKLKEALNDALSNLQSDDLFNIVEYSEDAYLWNIQKKNNQKVAHNKVNYLDLDSAFENLLVDPWSASKENIANAKKIVNNLEVRDATNLILPLELGLFILKIQNIKNPDYIPLLIFLTDGTPTAGLKKSQDILSKVTKDNFSKSMIYTLSFGEDANKQFLKDLALSNFGKHNHIYDDFDSVALFKNFFKSIAKPLLSNVEFSNISNGSEVTKTKFPVLFEGSELVLVGSTKNKPNIKIKAKGKKGLQELEPKLKIPMRKLEKVWAFFTLKHLLEMQHVETNDWKKKEILDYAFQIALNYSFVSEISSLVYFGPNGTMLLVSTKDGFLNGVNETKNVDWCNESNLKLIHLENRTFKPVQNVTKSPSGTELTSKISTNNNNFSSTVKPEIIGFKNCQNGSNDCCNNDVLKTNQQECEGPLPSPRSCSLSLNLGRTCLESKVQVKWYFDVQQGKCTEFEYKGCGGNSNQFVSLKECQKYCQEVTTKDRCLLPKSSGSGKANQTKWYFDGSLKKCLKFVYFGSDGNINRFDDYDSCGLECEVEKIMKPHPEQQEKCFFENEICPNASMNFYYYDKQTGKCTGFKSSPSCRNHHNRFRNLENCEKTCINPSKERICFLPPAKGQCNDQIPKYYFDKFKKDCYPFNYSGCNGNANQFLSRKQCLQECARVINNDSLQDICSLPVSFDNCTSLIAVKWYYSQQDGRCMKFNYGHCNEHSNKFDSKSECENICKRPKGKEICNLPKVSGPCNLKLKRWYFDRKSKTCKDFVYGGCHGNANNFQFAVDCVKQCGWLFQ